MSRFGTYPDYHDAGVSQERAKELEEQNGPYPIPIAIGPQGPRHPQSAFMEACLGDEVPELTRLSALRALIMEVKRLGLANDEDPAATSETITEVEQLFEMLRSAVANEARQGPQPRREESGKEST